MALPFLPGNTFNKNLGVEKFHLQHHFDYINNFPLNSGDDKKYKPNHSDIPRGQGAMAPAWVAFDKQVLRFNGYFKEAVVERNAENYRVRRIRLYFYLEDDTIQIEESPIKNSGISQGTLVRRQRIKLPPPNDSLFYTVEHFNVGNELEIYGKMFKLCDCDEFTLNFLRKLGVKINPPETIPDDPYSKHREEQLEAMQPLRPYERLDQLGQYLEHSGHVLRFYLAWDDSDTMYGDMREFVLHYYLADGMIEIKEVIPPNAGRDTTAMFLNKGLLPKHIAGLPLPGKTADRTVLNVFGPMGQGGRYILDSLKSGAMKKEYYVDSDLSIGAVLNVYGRKMMICDCDHFTRQYYLTKYGIEFKSLKVDRKEVPPLTREVPPYNGFGSYQDSLGNCDSLLPKPPHRDFMKFMEKDRNGLESNILRFVAVLLTKNKVDQNRKFIINYFLSDDSLGVFEPLVNNSGIMPGKFMERAPQPKPGQSHFSPKTPEIYRETDLFIGNVIELQSYKFYLVDADEYTYHYMETRPAQWPQCNLPFVVYKIKQCLGEQGQAKVYETFQQSDQKRDGTTTFQAFRDILRALCGQVVTEAEVVTLARAYGDAIKSGATYEGAPFHLLQAAVQQSLRRSNFEAFDDLLKALMLRDVEKSKELVASEVRKTCLAMHLSVANDLLSQFISRLATTPTGTGEGKVDYEHFVYLLNWKNNPVPISANIPVPIKFDSPSGELQKGSTKFVSYSKMIEDLFS